MNLEDSHLNCQIPCLQFISQGDAKPPPTSLIRRVKLMVRRRLSPNGERAFKNSTNNVTNRIYQLIGRNTKPSAPLTNDTSVKLRTGDWVRVRSMEEIEGTLNNWSQLKGCTFMPEMTEYCGTNQRVLKPMQRFVDERDLRVKKTRGIVLLEGTRCEGTAEFGRCDRSCYYFWREEWLEKIGEEDMK
jgi:hypothetical protein